MGALAALTFAVALALLAGGCGGGGSEGETGVQVASTPTPAPQTPVTPATGDTSTAREPGGFSAGPGADGSATASATPFRDCMRAHGAGFGGFRRGAGEQGGGLSEALEACAGDLPPAYRAAVPRIQRRIALARRLGACRAREREAAPDAALSSRCDRLEARLMRLRRRPLAG